MEVADDRHVDAEAVAARRTISGTAAAAASLLTVTRTSSEPACASWATWIAVASASAVSVLVIDWTTIGWRAADRHAADLDGDRGPASRPELVALDRDAASAVSRRLSSSAGGATGRSRACHCAPLPSRAMSKYVIQIRNANRNPKPDEVREPFGLRG